MAVPKKRTSRSKKNIRRSCWSKKVNKQANNALLLANSIFNRNSNSFVYPIKSNKNNKLNKQNFYLSNKDLIL